MVSELILKTITRRIEDYLKGICNIVEEKGYAKTRDVAKVLGVSMPSATEMLMKLADKKLIVYERYGGCRLTKEGLNIAKAVKTRHDTFLSLLEDVMFIPKHIAEKDAHQLEHLLNPETVEQFKKFVTFVNSHRRSTLLNKWRDYSKRN
jgi:DtxR family Mn-dependent transcriptional regulator